MHKILFRTLFLLVTISTFGIASPQTSPIATPSTYQLLANKLGHYGGSAAYGFNTPGQKLVHELLGFYDIPRADVPMKLAIASSVPAKNYDCHACAPKMSFFLFRWSGTEWKLTKSYINAHSAGQWGSAPGKDAYQIIALGEHDFGLFLKVFGTGQGCSVSRVILYLFEKTDVAEILNVESASDDLATGQPSRVNWQSKFQFAKGAGRFYDILLHRWGLEEGRQMDETIRYVYHDSAYKKTKLDSPSQQSLQKPPKSHSRRIVSKRLREGYRAIVTLDKAHFKFELAGNGDTVDLAFSKTMLRSAHMFGALTECRREGSAKLTHCEDLAPDLDPSSPTLQYKDDGRLFEVTVAYTDGGIAYKTMLYNDEKYLYWANYKKGKVVSLEKFEIER